MKKIYSEEKHFISLQDSLPTVLEAVIDSRFKYLKELEYENHKHASKILEEEYFPAVVILKKILETIK